METKQMIFGVIFTMTLCITAGKVRGGPEPYLIWKWQPPYNGNGNGEPGGYKIGHCYSEDHNMDENGQGNVSAVAAVYKKCTSVVYVKTGEWIYNAENTGGAVQSHFYLDNGNVVRGVNNEKAKAYVKIVLNEWNPNGEFSEQYKRKVWTCYTGPIQDIDETRYISGFEWKTNYSYESYVFVVAHSTAGGTPETGSAVNIDDITIHTVEWWGGVEDCGNNMRSGPNITLSHPDLSYVGALITVDGTLFSSNTQVTITFDTMEVATTNTDGSGDFTTTFYVPDVLGLSVVRAEDTEGIFAEEPLSVDCGEWPPTIVTLTEFTATDCDGYFEVKWTTATEIDNAGFNLYRSLSKDAPNAQLNAELIPAQGDELQGATYSFTDYDVTGGVTYYYWLEDVDLRGNSTMHGPVSVTPTSVEDKEEAPIPTVFSLAQNFPNPFNTTTEIRYGLSVESDVSLTIYNLAGQKVATLVDGKQKAGYKVARWDASSFPSGIYFYRLQAGDFVQTRKMILLK